METGGGRTADDAGGQDVGPQNLGDTDISAYDAVVVGAGFAGVTLARELAERGGRRVLVLEQRPHIGGNAYDHVDDAGVLVHKYGPHIFHTRIDRVFDHLSRFTSWNGYSHEVLADVHGTYLPVPFNKVSMRLAFGAERGEQLIAKMVARFGDGAKVSINELREEADPDLAEVAEYVYRNVFLYYTLKQWGTTPDKIDASVTARVPVFLSEDCRYFQDPFQGLPTDGYTELIGRMLDHPGITVHTGIDARAVLDLATPGVVKVAGQPFAGTVIYTGPLDELFDCRFGRLPYRSLDFVFETYEQDHFQPVGTVNYTVSEDYTRITEFKYLTRQELPGRTTIVREYPKDYEPDAGMDPYYPVLDAEHLALHGRYVALTRELPDFHPIGRLAEYRYYNMDATVANALELADRLLEEN
ncbi:UDP-galactopyranose mutase [Raineyella antarctica]|uniref:UDP-galactopyranose mutase n=1 Tax=Raineyella antarctica TaxID=1577474 RepID=UPI001C318DB5|nr:UDP-galactopyranose mutase [Raineyella antarctica]